MTTKVDATCWGFDPSGEEPTHVGLESAFDSEQGAPCDPPAPGDRVSVSATCAECGGGDFTMGRKMIVECDGCGTAYPCMLARPDDLVW